MSVSLGHGKPGSPYALALMSVQMDILFGNLSDLVPDQHRYWPKTLYLHISFFSFCIKYLSLRFPIPPSLRREVSYSKPGAMGILVLFIFFSCCFVPAFSYYYCTLALTVCLYTCTVVPCLSHTYDVLKTNMCHLLFDRFVCPFIPHGISRSFAGLGCR